MKIRVDNVTDVSPDRDGIRITCSMRVGDMRRLMAQICEEVGDDRFKEWATQLMDDAGPQ